MLEAIKDTRFQPGHTLSLRTGVHSQTAITPLAEKLLEYAVATVPAVTAFPIALDLWAQEMAIVVLHRRALDLRGVLDHNHEPRETLLRGLRAHTKLAMAFTREMGLTRKVAAELQLDAALAAQAAMGAAQRASSVPEPVRKWLGERGYPSPEEPGDGAAGDDA